MSSTEKLNNANMFLIGYGEYDRRGLIHQKYLTSENESRRALADILISGETSRYLLLQLAAVLAPDDYTNPALNFAINERKLVFKFRSNARRRDSVRNSAIAQYIQDHITEKKFSAAKGIASASEKYKLSEETIKRIWRSYRWARKAGHFNKGG